MGINGNNTATNGPEPESHLHQPVSFCTSVRCPLHPHQSLGPGWAAMVATQFRGKCARLPIPCVHVLGSASPQTLGTGTGNGQMSAPDRHRNPQQSRAHLIAANCATRKNPNVKSCLKRLKRLRMHFTPTSAS